MSNQQVEAIDRNIKAAKVSVDLGTALERLRGNADFKKVIIDGYFSKEAVRLVHLKSAPDMQVPERQRSILAQIDSIGALSAYLSLLIHEAAMAGKQIASDEEAREELLAEDLIND